MSQEFQQHWLSAYLDNELSNDERALVERHLKEDAEARQLLEDLKRVRSLVATLPGWPGAHFQFDMKRLADDELDDDDGQDSEPGSVSASPSSVSSSSPLTTKILEDRKPVLPLAAWRGVLALAASLLLLILCVPLFLQRNNRDMAVGMRAPQPDFPAGGGTGAGGRITGDASETQNASDTGKPVDLQSSKDAPALAARSDFGMAPQALPADPANAPEDPRQFPGSRGANNPPGPSAAAPPLPKSVPPLAPEGLRSAAGGLGGESVPDAMQPKKSVEPPKAERADAKPGDPVFDAVASSSPFLCAKSEAWSEAEIQQTLPQVLSQISENRVLADAAGKQKSSSDEVRTDAASRTVNRIEDKSAMASTAIGQNELLISDVPNISDLNRWFVQIQSAQPLTQLQLSSNLQLKKVNEREMLPESAALPSNARGVEPPAPAAASAKKDASPAVAKRDLAKSDAAEQPAVLGATTAQTEKRVQGQIILFVTETEAAKIRASVLELAGVNFVRVPSQPSEPAQQKSDDKKVIVILNQR